MVGGRVVHFNGFLPLKCVQKISPKCILYLDNIHSQLKNNSITGDKIHIFSVE